jgi:hypothetical protein
MHTRKPNGRGGGPGGSQSQQSHCALAVLNDTEPNTAIAANNKRNPLELHQTVSIVLGATRAQQAHEPIQQQGQRRFQSADTLMMT